MAPGLFLGPDHKTTTVAGGAENSIGIVRADHPLVPEGDGTYYFEVKIEHVGKDLRKFGVGFCEETAQLEDQMLGCREGSWGYHGDGKIFESEWWGGSYGPLYGEGDTIGCGINIEEKAAFYTKNGKIIGRAFSNIRGKLFPAVSVDLKYVGCSISVKFVGANEQRSDIFMFTGPYTGDETLKEPQWAEDQRGEGNKQTEAEEIKRGSSHMFDGDSDDSDSDSYSSMSD